MHRGSSMVLCKENFANIRVCVTNVHKQFMNIHNALFYKLNNLALGW